MRFLGVHCRIGYQYTLKHVLSTVQVVDSKGIKAQVSNVWWEAFLRRHLSLTLRIAVPLSVARAIATDDKLEETLEAINIFDKASNIFNCDEIGFALALKAPRVVCTVGTKAVSHLTSDTKSQNTMLVCTSASGCALPPFVKNPVRCVSKYQFTQLFSIA